MSQTEFIFDATAENFQQLVLENSARGPVLVNFWSPGVGPCLRVWETLQALVGSYQGRFLLVNVNTEKQKQLTSGLGVNSLPTVHVYRDGEVVHRIHGAESEKSFIDTIDKHLVRPSDKVLNHAMSCFQSGDQDKALDILFQLSQAEPDNLRVPVTLLKLLIAMQRYQDGLDYIAGLEPDMQKQAEIGALQTHMEILLASGEDESVLLERLQKKDEPETRFKLAANYVVANQYEQALEQLLAIVEKNREFRDDAGRRSMLALFDLLGREHPLTEKYWTRLSSYLH